MASKNEPDALSQPDLFGWKKSRREFLGDLGALAAAAALSAREGKAQTAGANRGWIDVHSHMSTPDWLKVFAEKGHKGLFDADTALPQARVWSPAKLIESMDRAKVSVSILSMTWPGIWFGEKEDSQETVRQRAREWNDAGGKLITEHPGRIGLFAVLPLPDMDGSLREMEYALDTLKADGVGLLTSYDNKWLGDPVYAPVFQELNRRKAVVYTHPKIDGLYGPAGSDTTRTISSMLRAHTASQYPDIRFIFSHAGGTMPYLIERIIGHDKIAQRLNSPAAPHTPLFDLRTFYYDTAQSANPATIAGLRKVIPVSQIVFGTDFPYGGADLPATAKELVECGQFNTEELAAVGRGNITKLLPKYNS